MKHFFALVTFGAFLILPLAAQSGKVFIVQTNSAGDSVSLDRPDHRQGRGRDPRGRGDPRRRRRARRQPAVPQRRGLDTVDVVDTKTMRITKRIPLTGRPNNIAIQQERQEGLCGDRGRAGRRRRDRPGHAGADQAHPHPRRRAQHLHHARQQVRRGRSTGGSVATVIDTETRARGLVDSLRGRRAPDLLRGQSGRLDQADVRADHEPARLRDRRLGAAQGSGPHQPAGPSARAAEQRGDPGRAGARHPDCARRQDVCGRRASSTAPSTPIRCPT